MAGGGSAGHFQKIFDRTDQPATGGRPMRKSAKALPAVSNSIVPTKADGPASITTVEYGGLQAAFDYLNARLFGGQLPDAFITYQRQAHSKGYFSEDRFSARDGEFKKPEIALNPDAFIDRTDKQIVSTLAHEMTHLRQYRFGKPSKRGYHNRQWAGMMKECQPAPAQSAARKPVRK
jgi:SprT-like family